MESKKFYKVGIFIFIVTFGITISLIYYGILTMYLPTDSTLGEIPFNTATFVFAMTYAVLIPIIIFFSGKKTKKKMQELMKKKRL